MKEKLLLGIILGFLLLCAGVPGVMAQNFDNIDQNVQIDQIRQGHTIFFGEERLDVADCVQGAGYVVALDPQYNVTDSIKINNQLDFTLPIDKPENNWYQSDDGIHPRLDGTGNATLAFISQIPEISFDIWNADTDTRIDSVAYRGNLVRFKFNVETNLDDITTRLNYADFGSYINMSVVAPDGEQLLRLMTLDSETGISEFKSLLNLDVDPSAGWIWPENIQPGPKVGWWTGWRNADPEDESDYRYPIGTYSAVALCNVNNMFKNYQNSGATWSERTVDLQARPLSITTSGAPAGRDKQFTVTVTGLPQTDYQLFIFDECPTKLTGKICDRPPYIVGDRDQLVLKGIALDAIDGPYTTGNVPVVDCCTQNTTIRRTVPSGEAYPSAGSWDILEDGTRYYATVTTGPDGTVTVPFWVDTTVDEGVYTVQVQDYDYEEKASAEIPISKGTITIQTYDASGEAGTDFYLGDEIWIDGSNTDSNLSFVWLTGPGLDPCGVNLYNPFDFTPVKEVVYDTKNGKSNYWRVDPNWVTNDTPIAPGTYTLWVASVNPDGRFCSCSADGCSFCSFGDCLGVACERGICELQNCPECAVLSSIEINLKEPVLTGELGDVAMCCCPGYPCGQLGGTEEILLTGMSGGNYCKNLQVWMFGQSQFGTRNYLQAITPIYCDDTYEFELNKGLLQPNQVDLCQLTPGVYDIIVQAPGNNGMFDVRLGDSEQNGDRFVLTTMPTDDSKLFQIEGKNAYYGRVALKALTDGMEKPGIDDIWVHVQFNLTEKKCEGNVDFKADRTEGNAPLTVQFTDTSVMEGVSWAWFSNGAQFSTEQNPKYTFTDPGKYTLEMDVTDASGLTNSAVKESYINVLSSPVADFTYGPNPASMNEAIQFTDQSMGTPTSWMWSFGDGATSSLQSPAHAYAEPGTYSVTLEISNAMGVGSTKVIPVLVVHDPPTADFSADPIYSEYYPALVNFIDLSSGYISGWDWKMSREGQTIFTSAEENPVITFSDPGIYTVSLTVSNDGGSDTMTKENYVSVGSGNTFYLSSGWNHVSVPKKVTADYDTVSKLFSGVDTGGIPFAVYSNDLNTWINVTDDYAVQPLEAYRVNYVAGPTEISPDYIETGTLTRSLSMGWNGIGIMAMEPTSANVALASLGESWDKILKFNPETQRWEYPIIRGVDDTKTLDPMIGYLIQMNQDGILIGGEV